MRAIALLLFLSVALVSAGQGAYFSHSTGARPLGMGNAYYGLADDASALFTNPAGLADLRSFTLISTYTQPDPDIMFTSLGGAAPLLGGVIGAGYRGQTISGLQISAEIVSLTNQELLVSYSRRLSEAVFLAADYRSLTKFPSKDYPGSDSASGSGGALDLSLKYLYLPYLSFGLAWQELGGRFNYKNGVTETFPANIIVGSAWRIRPELLFDVDVSKEDGRAFLLHSGVEWSPVSVFSLRLGADQSATASDVFVNLTGGLGVRLAGFSLDYAFYRQGDISQAVSHYFSVGYLAPIRPRPVSAEAAGIPSPEPVAAVKIERVRFPDVPYGYYAKEPIELLATAGVIWGYPDKMFRPNRKVSRSEFAAILSAAKHIEAPAFDNPNKLVTRAEAASQLDFTDPVSRPNQPITRAEIVMMIYNTPLGQAAIKRLPPLAD